MKTITSDSDTYLFLIFIDVRIIYLFINIKSALFYDGPVIIYKLITYHFWLFIVDLNLVNGITNHILKSLFWILMYIGILSEKVCLSLH